MTYLTSVRYVVLASDILSKSSWRKKQCNSDICRNLNKYATLKKKVPAMSTDLKFEYYHYVTVQGSLLFCG